MTEWEWQVIMALVRLVLKIESRTNEDSHEYIDMIVAEERAILEEALRREDNKK